MGGCLALKRKEKPRSIGISVKNEDALTDIKRNSFLNYSFCGSGLIYYFSGMSNHLRVVLFISASFSFSPFYLQQKYNLSLIEFYPIFLF
jgi:hypothetical protein